MLWTKLIRYTTLTLGYSATVTVHQGWQYGTVRSEFAYYVPRTLNRTVPAYRTSLQFLKRTVPVPVQKKRTVLLSKN